MEYRLPLLTSTGETLCFRSAKNWAHSTKHPTASQAQPHIFNHFEQLSIAHFQECNEIKTRTFSTNVALPGFAHGARRRFLVGRGTVLGLPTKKKPRFRFREPPLHHRRPLREVSPERTLRGGTLFCPPFAGLSRSLAIRRIVGERRRRLVPGSETRSGCAARRQRRRPPDSSVLVRLYERSLPRSAAKSEGGGASKDSGAPVAGWGNARRQAWSIWRAGRKGRARSAAAEP